MAERRTVIKWVAIGCGSVAILGVLAFVGCVTICAGGIRSVTAAQGHAEGFLGDLRADNIEAAYARMDERYQADNNLEAFRESVARLPALTEHTDWTFNSFNVVGPGQTNIGGRLRSPAGVTRVMFVLLLQPNDTWRIESVTVGDQSL